MRATSILVKHDGLLIQRGAVRCDTGMVKYTVQNGAVQYNTQPLSPSAPGIYLLSRPILVTRLVLVMRVFLSARLVRVTRVFLSARLALVTRVFLSARF